MNLYLLKESTSWTEGRKTLAICTTIEKALEMLTEWYNEEREEKAELEECEATITIEGVYSVAQVSSKETNAWELLEIERGWTNDWLD